MPKFKIGDWVTSIGSEGGRLKMNVVGIMQDTCPAGTQFHYTLRTYLKEKEYDSPDKKYSWYPARAKDNQDYVRYNECELVLFVE